MFQVQVDETDDCYKNRKNVHIGESNYYRVNKGKNKSLNDNHNHLINNHQLLKFDTFMYGYGPVRGV